MSAKRALISRAMLLAAVGGVIAFSWHGLAPEVVAAAITALVADSLARPLVTAYLAARWERAHGQGRLFQPLVQDEKGAKTLYVAEHPVPAA